MKSEKLGILNIALLYVGTIMGAGFASGREIWQFFGVFGGKGYIGIGLIGILFVLIGIITCKIARRLSTNAMGAIIVPSENKMLMDFIGYFMAFMLFTVLVTMSAAGGALFHQQFGASRVLGGVVITGLVVITVMGGFGRVSRVFGYIMPLLVAVVVLVSLLVMMNDLPVTDVKTIPMPSPLAPNWPIAALLYISYNVLAIVPVVSTAAIHAKTERHALLGIALGGLFLGVLAFLLVSALLTEPNFSQSMDMPLLGFASFLPEPIHKIYTVVLMFAIFASATSNYYGFTTMVKEGPKKKIKVFAIAWLGFFFGLAGFTNVVAYMFPIEGYLGFGIILMLTVNFLKTGRKSNGKNQQKRNV